MAQQILETEDTFAVSSITGLIEAVDMAIEDGYRGPEYDGDEPQSVKDARTAYWQIIGTLWGAGKVGVERNDGWLILTYKKQVKQYRGSSVEGCGYDDDFVRHLARKFRDETDTKIAAKLNPEAV